MMTWHRRHVRRRGGAARRHRRSPPACASDRRLVVAARRRGRGDGPAGRRHGRDAGERHRRSSTPSRPRCRSAPTSSGGVLLDSHGRVVGILDGQTTDGDDTVGVFVPAPLAEGVAQELATEPSGGARAGWVSMCTDGTSGAAVVQHHPREPGAGAGLEPGDVVDASTPTAVDSVADLQERLYTIPPGHDRAARGGARRGHRRHDGEAGQLARRRLIGPRICGGGVGERGAPPYDAREWHFPAPGGRRQFPRAAPRRPPPAHGWRVARRWPRRAGPHAWPRAWPAAGSPRATSIPGDRMRIRGAGPRRRDARGRAHRAAAHPHRGAARDHGGRPGAWAWQTVEDWRFLLEAMGRSPHGGRGRAVGQRARCRPATIRRRRGRRHRR